MKNLSVLLTSVFVLTGVTFSQTRIVDNFINGKDSVAVFFYDPLLRLRASDRSFESQSDKEKSDALDKYLHGNPLYLFRLTNNTTRDTRYLCIRGNPKKERTRMFYQVEVIKNVPADFDPTTSDYADKVTQVIDQVNCGGSVFEHMSLFDGQENKNDVGNGIQLYGLYRRVHPYSEIRASIVEIIGQLEK